MNYCQWMVTCLCVSLSASAGAQVRLPQFFGSGMVVQRGEKIPVWGHAATGEAVRVSMNGHVVSTRAGADGRWSVQLPPMQAGGPFELVINDSLRLSDVLVGDVFLCSGQSNMELPLSRCMDKVADEVKDYANAQIRYLKLPPQFNYIRPNEDVQTLGWQAVNPQSAQQMSAVSYFVGRCLQEAEHVPIGIINSSVGGTRVECWMSRDTLLCHPEYAEELQQRKYFQENWVDSVRRVENQRGYEWERRLLQVDTISGRWCRPGYSFAGWRPVDLFQNWALTAPAGTSQKATPPGVNGTFWFRHTFHLTADQSEGSALLRLGAMKDADSVFVNGRCVGFTPYQYPPRNYHVPQGVLREGENDIVIKLISQNGLPNFTEGKSYQLELATDTLSLTDGWTMARGAVLPAKPGSTYFVDTPTGLYNAMIAPFRQLPICGAVWYQGESNTGNAATYASLLRSLVRCWRNQFGREFPVVIVQLPNYMSRHAQPLRSSGWCDIRLAQREAVETLPKAALVAAPELGEFNDIHPQQKDELGRRVALQFRRLVYGEKNLVAEGPRPLSAVLKDSVVIIHFDRRTGALRPAAGMAGFTLVLAPSAEEADGEPAVVWAEGRTMDDFTVQLRVPAGRRPVQVRYAYDDDPVLSLYNQDGLPSPCFLLEIKK